MPYEARGNYSVRCQTPKPGLFIFLLDQSASMEGNFGGKTEILESPKKMHVAADAINHCLSGLILRCREGGEIKPRVDIGIITYGPNNTAQPVWQERILSVRQLPNKILRTETRKKRMFMAGEEVDIEVPFEIWFEPTAENGTPMYRAFEIAKDIIEEWTQQHLESPAPIIINITDGEYTDAYPKPITDKIVELGTNDGKTLIFNCHISSTRGSTSLLFPSSLPQIEDKYARELFEISSYIPPTFRSTAQVVGLPIEERSVGFIFNADAGELIRLIKFGTQATMSTESR